jgi:hypothetical protein
VKLELVIVAASIAREKVAVGATPVATPVAPSAGVFAVTVGAAFTVVNDQVTSAASATPSAAFTAVVTLAVYVVPFASGADGVSVAVVQGVLQLTFAATALPPAGVSVKLELVSVEASIARENVAVGAAPTATPVDPSAGARAVTVGAAATVVNCQVTSAASATPSAALTAVVTLAVYVVPFASGALGFSVATLAL